MLYLAVRKCRVQRFVRSSSTSEIIASAELKYVHTYPYLICTTQMGYLSIIVTLSRGSLQHKRDILGYRIALSTFDNNYLLGKIQYIVQCRSLRKYAHMPDMCSGTRRILISHWLKMPCNLTPLPFHMWGVSPIKECGWTRNWGVKRGVNKIA